MSAVLSCLLPPPAASSHLLPPPAASSCCRRRLLHRIVAVVCCVMSLPLSAASSTVLLLSVVVAIAGQLVGFKLQAMAFDAALCHNTDNSLKNTSSGSNTSSQPRPQHLGTGEYKVRSTTTRPTTAGKARSATTLVGKAEVDHHDSGQGGLTTTIAGKARSTTTTYEKSQQMSVGTWFQPTITGRTTDDNWLVAVRLSVGSVSKKANQSRFRLWPKGVKNQTRPDLKSLSPTISSYHPLYPQSDIAKAQLAAMNWRVTVYCSV
ncbi:hypothetical protein EDB89DRAFT_1906594 [Lactarius sanguifluus]|nr:hypothetical protein EDB89DRAFT_1906594 [Lactarius sanguifluus]